METYYNQLYTACTHSSPKKKIHYLQHHCVHKHIFQYYASNVNSSQYKDHSLGCIKYGFTSLRKRDIYNTISIQSPVFTMEMYVLFILILNKWRITTGKNTSLASDFFSFEN